MTFSNIVPMIIPTRCTTGVLLVVTLLAGCSQDYVSYDDVRVQNTAEERFPISVVEEPVKINVAAARRSLSPEQMNVIIGFARQAAANDATSISILYANANPNGRAIAAQAAKLLEGQGIAAASLNTAAYNGGSNYVTLTYYSKVARTNDCGDWSQNMAGNQYNELYPNYGCAIQSNFAAMVEDPDDFLAPRGLAPATGASRSAVIRKYNEGGWSQEEQVFPDAAITPSTQ